MLDAIAGTWYHEAIAAAVIGVGGYVFRLAYRIEVLDRLFSEKKASLETVLTGHADHDTRISVIESVIEDLKELAPALRSIIGLTSKMDALLENAHTRLGILEDHILKNKK